MIWWTQPARFPRVASRRRARAFVLRLLAELPRKNCWIIAGRDAGAVRDDIRGYVTAHLGHPQAVLVGGEPGDLKKGTATAGVQRQYAGTAGRTGNAQVAVYLSSAGRGGHELTGRELYLPVLRTDDPVRCRAARIPTQVTFATEAALARKIIARALDAGVPAAWVAGIRSTARPGPARGA